jgi:hypothetical protein
MNSLQFKKPSCYFLNIKFGAKDSLFHLVVKKDLVFFEKF